ncbi:MFS transporter [Deinococcus metallilatus]|uniref:MFS family permease n=1 Tax=Deinococcus metallilatus TaxID=1211322 RepID=A0AAJ5F4T7_9DEIO|nr:MFS transporter [Deinococcus metallilatus]MBB5295445.1 MFS family permease [Deinococcus metallilatus]QBY08033.1 MFS transporter [Deinococcus metallilatus]RXJ12926.1 MFS transporter [Deinococcus metallilatus]TLK27152.1 MFS transporter [Deinococcus metallilatus]GMA16123.1 putative transporter, MFS family protein [Deinococcus metallilatus]
MSDLSRGQRFLMWTLAVLTTVSYGALYYAQPLLAVAAEHERGWTRTQTGLAFTLALLVTALTAPAVGRALDARGGRVLVGGGALLGGAAFVLLALTHGYPLFVIGWLLAGVAMALTFYEAAFTVLGQQVGGATRTRATLTITLVAGLASTIFVPLTTALLAAGGLQGALLVLAALLVSVGLLAWWMLPAAGASTLDKGRVAFTPDQAFVRLMVAFTLARVVTVGVGLQLAPLLLAAAYAPGLAAALTGLLGLTALPGRVMFVPLLGRLGALPLTLLLFMLLGLGALLLRFTASPALTVTAIVLFGLSSGALTLARAELLTRWYPPETFGTANGLMARPVNLAQAFTPLGMGALFTLTGGYGWSFTLLAVLAALAAWVATRSTTSRDSWGGYGGDTNA